MRHRDLLTIREHRAEVEAQERAERERIERPIREAEARLKETHRKLHAVAVERLLGKVKDPDRVPVDAELIGAKMSRTDADKFNVAEFRKFRESHPEVYLNPELLENMGAYWDANGLQIISANMLSALIDRYRHAGLLPDAPAPDPEPLPAPEPEAAKPAGPVVHIGVDWQTGREREFTRREVDRMSADEFRKFFPVARTFAEVLTAMKEQRDEA
jgi:hypothetical protein